VKGMVNGKNINLWEEDKESYRKLYEERGKIIKEYVKKNLPIWKSKNYSKEQVKESLDVIMKGKNNATNQAKSKLGMDKGKGLGLNLGFKLDLDFDLDL